MLSTRRSKRTMVTARKAVKFALVIAIMSHGFAPIFKAKDKHIENKRFRKQGHPAITLFIH